jgi:glycosyltransferase involved in cell wall biosynthesis
MPRLEKNLFSIIIRRISVMKRKKNIIVTTSAVPFYHGGNERLAGNLVKALDEAGYNAWPFFTPRNQYDSFSSLLGGYVSNRLIDLKGYPWKNKIDQLISLTYPSYVIQHPNHVSWFTHRMREYYDLWDRWLAVREGAMSRLGLRLQRKILRSIDDHYISRLKKLYCISSVVRDRLKKWGDHDSEILYPPPDDDGNYSSDVYKPYIFALSRLTSMKRMHLLVDAMSLVKNKRVQAFIAGEGEEKDNLGVLIENLKLSSRVKLLGKIGEAEKHKLLMECRGFFFAPYQEEYGIVAVEAMKRSKAVITSPDSGGPLDFVADGKSGLVAVPDAQSVADAIDRLAVDEETAVRLGRAAAETVRSICWKNVVKRIVNL